jgi:hypothetical protein
MLRETDFKFYCALIKQAIPESQVPKRVIKSIEFGNLIDSGIIKKVGSGRGISYSIMDQNKFQIFIEQYFPNGMLSEEMTDKNDVAGVFRDSKAKVIPTNPIFFLRGFKNTILNAERINLEYYTNKFGVFAVQSLNISTDKICIVENLDTFLSVEKLLGKDFIYLHKYGRIGKTSLESIQASEILVFSDYDFVGLNEYLCIKEVHPHAKFFIPENYEELFKKYSKTLPEKQNPSIKVMNSQMDEVSLIRDGVLKSQRYLEQQILFNIR